MKKNVSVSPGMALAAIAALGFVLRAALLPVSAVWLDEAFSIELAQKSFADIVTVLQQDNGSPLFYFLLHGWIRLFGTGERVCTLLTVLLSCASLTATIALLVEVFKDVRVRLTGAALMALAPVCLHQATNLRYYSLLVLCVAGSYLFFYRALRTGRARDWALFILASLAGLYGHTLYALVPAAQFLLLILFYRRRFASGLIALLIAALGYLPWLPILVLQTLGYAREHVPDTIPRLDQYGGALPAYLHTIGDRLWTFSAMPAFRWISAALFLGFAFICLFREQTADRRKARDFLTAHLVSVGLLVLISLVRPVFWLDKFDLIGLPLVFGLAGFVLTRLPLRAAAIALVFAVNITGTARYMQWRITGGLDAQRETIEQIGRQITPDDAVIQTGITHFTVNYYLDRKGIATGPRYVFPVEQKNRPSSIDTECLLRRSVEITFEARHLMHVLRDVPGRIYVFYSPYKGLRPLYDALDASFKKEATLPVRSHPWGPLYTRVDIYRLP